MKKRNLFKALSMAALLTIVSCTQDESTNSELQSDQQSNLSTKSEELSISGIEASEEQSANPAINAIDNSDTSRWSGYGDNVDLILDLGSSQSVDYLKIAFLKGDERKSYFAYHYSVDGSTWSGGKTKTSSGKTSGLEIFDIDNESGVRYIKLVFGGTSEGLWNSVLDIEVYGTQDSVAEETEVEEVTEVEEETEEVDIEEIPTTGSTSGSVEGILGDFWKVTVPVDKNGDSSPLDCSEYDCRNNNAVDLYGLDSVAANSNYSDFFYESDGWAVFTAFCGGATTTNSQYPRCELRGLNASGDDDYFDMKDHQELEVTVKVLEVPTERPEVNMVQIHGPKDEPLRVEYNDGSTGSDQGLHLTVNEKSTLDDIMDYEIGQELKVWVKVEDRHLWIELDNLSTGGHYETDFDVEDKTGYWKVGCYLQSSITYCDVKSSGSFCSNGGQSDDYYATGSVAAKDLTLIRDGQTYK